jgi:predicted PurR-regulated permease PerM
MARRRCGKGEQGSARRHGHLLTTLLLMVMNLLFIYSGAVGLFEAANDRPAVRAEREAQIAALQAQRQKLAARHTPEQLHAIDLRIIAAQAAIRIAEKAAGSKTRYTVVLVAGLVGFTSFAVYLTFFRPRYRAGTLTTTQGPKTA